MAGSSVADLRAALAALNLDSRGTKDTLKKRLTRAKAKKRVKPPPAEGSQDGAPGERSRPPGQEYDSFLVFDVEATCERIEGPYGRLAFSYPNEIIEWPVVLLQWRRRERRSVDEDVEEEDWELTKVDEYHSFVRPIWKPQLSDFCTELTGITQSDVDAAPTFPKLCEHFYRNFCVKHHLFTPGNRTLWATDGPWDLRDFVAKTCYLSRTERPPWLAGDIIDLRIAVSNFFSDLKEQKKQRQGGHSPSPPHPTNAFAALGEAAQSSSPSPSPPAPPPPAEVEAPLPSPIAAPTDPSLLAPSTPPAEPIPTYLPSHQLSAPPNLSLNSVLAALTLPPFEGRLHSGLCDARNAARILIDLAARGVALEANRRVPEGGKGGKERRWGWMTKKGEVKWEEHVKWEEGRAAKEREEGGKKYVRKEETE
ncbi:hypothetical protein JCM10213_006385 [Rhodosporidiobolus nylandii]